MSSKVGYIGLGHMGGPMAMHLAKAGHDVSVYNRTRSKAEAFVSQYGGRVATSPADAVTGAAYVGVCVFGDDDVREISLGDDGAFEAMTPGAVLADHTTASAETAELLGSEADKRGFFYLDAPVAGAEEASKAGQLTVMIGGAEEGFQKAEPFLDVYAKAAELMGPNGHGQLTKMVNQIMISANMQGLAEGIVMGQETGLDMEKVLRLLGQGSAQSWWLDNRGARMATATLDDSDGGTSNMTKDLGICLNEARRHGISLPITSLIAQFYVAAKARGRDRWESTSLITLWDRRYD
ncbi:MAG: NAD(P)-dependent oxidoreductase [Rhodospirillaceae bacterium]|nr:NAD(P)-dependent oxidoreductase [Rhodospirillaceae bacterium]